MTDARPADPTSALSPADALAAAGDWPAAVEAWQRAAEEDPSVRPEVERRLEWFLAETGQRTPARRHVLPLVLACLIATALGTAFLSVAGQPGSLSANLLAIGAWAMTAVAIVTALIAARRSGDAPIGQLIASARSAARQFERDSVTGEHA